MPRLIPDAEACRHDLLVEFHGQVPDRSGMLTFLSAFDRALHAGNPEYRSKRTSGRLLPPQLSAMGPGWSERTCLAELRAGRREAQHKWRAMGVPWDEASRAAVVTSVALASPPVDGATAPG